MLEKIRTRKPVFIGGAVALMMVATVACSSDSEEAEGEDGLATVAPIGQITNVPGGTTTGRRQ